MASLPRGGGLRNYRLQELTLFIIPFIILIMEMTQLLLVQPGVDPQTTFTTKSLPPVEALIPVLGLIGLYLVVNIVFSIFFPRADQMLFPLVGLLAGIGVLMATRLGPTPKVQDPTLGTKQLIWVILGIIVCLGTIFILRNTSWLRRYKYTWALVSLAAITPSVINGIKSIRTGAPTHDTLNISSTIAFQPSELLKIAVVIFFAGYLSENLDIFAEGGRKIGPFRLPPARLLGPLILMLGLALIIFFVVRELGLAILIYGLFLCMMYLGSGRFSYIVWNLLLFAAVSFLAYLFLGKIFGYVEGRFAVVGFDAVNWQNWTQKDVDFIEGPGLQVVQGLINLSSGGIIGAGLGLGHPGSIVPVIQSDMVFTALGEEFGAAGLFGIIGIYLLIVYRGFRIAIEATEPFNQLLAAGLTSVFAIQTLIIALGNMKVLPLTGIPLPFLSYGGSSIIANFIIIGILLRISHNTALEREGLL